MARFDTSIRSFSGGQGDFANVQHRCAPHSHRQARHARGRYAYSRGKHGLAGHGDRAPESGALPGAGTVPAGTVRPAQPGGAPAAPVRLSSVWVSEGLFFLVCGIMFVR